MNSADYESEADDIDREAILRESTPRPLFRCGRLYTDPCGAEDCATCHPELQLETMKTTQLNITQRTVDQIVARAQNSMMGLGDPDKGRRSYDIKQHAEPYTMETLAILFVSAHFAKWDLISLMKAALEVVSGEDSEALETESHSA